MSWNHHRSRSYVSQFYVVSRNNFLSYVLFVKNYVVFVWFISKMTDSPSSSKPPRKLVSFSVIFQQCSSSKPFKTIEYFSDNTPVYFIKKSAIKKNLILCAVEQRHLWGFFDEIFFQLLHRTFKDCSMLSIWTLYCF